MNHNAYSQGYAAGVNAAIRKLNEWRAAEERDLIRETTLLQSTIGVSSATLDAADHAVRLVKALAPEGKEKS
jgi:hypothetical protein